MEANLFALFQGRSLGWILGLGASLVLIRRHWDTTRQITALVKVFLPMAGGWSGMSFKVPPNPFCDSVLPHFTCGPGQKSDIKLTLKRVFSPSSCTSIRAFLGTHTQTISTSFSFLCTRGKAGSAFAGMFEAGSQTLSAGGGSWFPGIAEQILCSLHVYPEEQVVRAFKASVLARLSLTAVCIVCLGKL